MAPTTVDTGTLTNAAALLQEYGSTFTTLSAEVNIGPSLPPPEKGESIAAAVTSVGADWASVFTALGTEMTNLAGSVTSGAQIYERNEEVQATGYSAFQKWFME